MEGTAEWASQAGKLAGEVVAAGPEEGQPAAAEQGLVVGVALGVQAQVVAEQGLLWCRECWLHGLEHHDLGGIWGNLWQSWHWNRGSHRRIQHGLGWRAMEAWPDNTTSNVLGKSIPSCQLGAYGLLHIMAAVRWGGVQRGKR